MGHLGSYELDSLCQEPHSIVVFYEQELQVEVLYLPGSFIIKKKKKNDFILLHQVTLIDYQVCNIRSFCLKDSHVKMKQEYFAPFE